MRNGDFSELLANRGSNLNSIPQLRIPQGFPDAGQPAPNNDMRPYITATRQVPREPVSAAELQRSEQSVQLRLQPARAARTAPTSRRGSTGTSATARRPTSGSRARPRLPRARAACGGRPSDVVALPTPNIGKNKGRSYAGNVVSVLSPSMTNEALVSYSRLTLDNHFKDPSLLAQGRRRHHLQRHLPGRHDEPVPADRPAPRVGRQRPGRQPLGHGERHVRAQRCAAVQRQADQAARHARR